LSDRRTVRRGSGRRTLRPDNATSSPVDAARCGPIWVGRSARCIGSRAGTPSDRRSSPPRVRKMLKNGPRQQAASAEKQAAVPKKPHGRLELTWMGKDLALIPYVDGK